MKLQAWAILGSISTDSRAQCVQTGRRWQHWNSFGKFGKCEDWKDIDKPPTSFGLSIFVRVPIGFLWKGNETLRWCIDKLPTSFGFRILVAVPIEFLCKEGRAQNTALAHR